MHKIEPGLIIDLERALDTLYSRFVLAVEPDQGGQVLDVIDCHLDRWRLEQTVEDIYLEVER